MEGNRNPLIRMITKRTMEYICNQVKLETSVYNIIYDEIQKMVKVVLDSR